jgi:putative hydrolase of the HAD superfamily
MALEAVLWDFGGVFTTSPFDAFNRYERERGLPVDFIRGVNAINPDTNAWARLERSEITAADFDTLFRTEAEARGHSVGGADVLALLSGDVRPNVVAALKTCKAAGLRVGCITNNAPTGKGAGMARSEDKARQVAEIMAQFEHVIESSKAGVRKPDPRIYLMMCEHLGVEPAACVYIDDLGINLKPARELGMTTIKAVAEAQILDDLERATGLTFTRA